VALGRPLMVMPWDCRYISTYIKRTSAIFILQGKEKIHPGFLFFRTNIRLQNLAIECIIDLLLHLVYQLGLC